MVVATLCYGHAFLQLGPNTVRSCKKPAREDQFPYTARAAMKRFKQFQVLE